MQNFLRIFDRAITYRRTRDPHQIHRSKKLSPEINSDQNLNGRSLIKNSLFKRKCTNMLQALRMHTFLTPYYSSSRGWDILLYESLGIKVNFKERFCYVCVQRPCESDGRRNARAYAFGVRHVAPSPPGEARAGGAMLRATGDGCEDVLCITIFAKF